MLKPKIIFEDNDILVINKPAGLVVNRSETVHKGTLQDWIDQRSKIKNLRSKIEEESDFYKRTGLVHRLDKDTSGVMVIAKTPQAFLSLVSQFKERKVEKRYLALVHGQVEPKVGNVRMPLARSPKDRKKFTVRLRGREAVTFYKRIKILHFPFGEVYSLLEIKPETGRTHQIRVHLAHIGYPIVGDPIYLSLKRLKKDREFTWRLFLHAENLSFYHPQTQEKLSFNVPLPKELKKIKTEKLS